jgi:cbb3-type cytochrome c oxidase subunit II
VQRFVRMSYLVACVGGVGFFGMSVLLLGVWPGRVLQDQIRSTSPAHPLALTAAEQRGRAVYGQDGCAYCHTQQIRYIDRDVRRFGKSTLAWETIFDYPHLWGTRRIGPDLSRQGAIRSTDWEFAHLFAPRNMVADSVMPAFPWLFDGSPDKPKQDGRDLVAYLATLGRDRELAGPEGEAKARAACQCSDEERRLAFDATALNTSPSMTRRQGKVPQLPPSQDRARGLQLYARNCASCHGIHGDGTGPGAPGLHPHPANFVEHQYTDARLSFALWNGVDGTAMPGWRDMPLPDLSAIALVVKGFAAAQAQPQNSNGAQIYADHCAQCHGEKGAGDGPAADRFSVAPTNFQAVRPSRDASVRALRNGVDGTSMGPWTTRLSDGEINAVADYVRGLFQ